MEIFHEGLHKHEFLRAIDPSILRNKANIKAVLWNEMWRKQVTTEARIKNDYDAKAARKLHIENQKEIAVQRTVEAHEGLNALRNALLDGILPDPRLDWEELKVKTPFPKESPIKPSSPKRPLLATLPLKPESKAAPTEPGTLESYLPVRLSLLDRFLTSRKRLKYAAAKSRFEGDSRSWLESCAALAYQYEADLRDWKSRCAALHAQHELALEAIMQATTKLQEEHQRATTEWDEEKEHYEREQAKQHETVDEFRKRYELKNEDGVMEYCERVLSRSDYPPCIPREFELELHTETGMLLLNCSLPAPADIPILTEVKYVQSLNVLREVFLSESQAAKLYDDVVYQISLRTIHELFQSDYIGAISTVILNGIVRSTDKSTGNDAVACILSVQAVRESFLAINLAKVDPKACFRQLKGVGSSKLHSVAAVAPIAELKRDDRRFVPSYGVAEHLNKGCNLALMDWEDFEHLIREIFEKEFSSNGGEVKVTQASRDGGVDAVAFDPDPIRGGKIVIQAKRYAHTVGVSAVRDLYGTVMNEGASKGILVTTSDYGPDAYQFASGKPLTLLSGSNLMHLLAKHGVNAHINLTEARKAAQDRSINGGSLTLN
jgi:restriction system protein